MGLDNVPLRLFLQTLGRWLAAVEAQRHDQATFYCRELCAVGQLLTADPEFRAIYARVHEPCPVTDPDVALLALHALCAAAAQAARPGHYRDSRGR